MLDRDVVCDRVDVDADRCTVSYYVIDRTCDYMFECIRCNRYPVCDHDSIDLDGPRRS